MLLVFFTGCLAIAGGILLLVGPVILGRLNQALENFISYLERKVLVFRIVIGILLFLWGVYFIYLYFEGLRLLS